MILLFGTRNFCVKFHRNTSEIFHSGPKWWGDWAIAWAGLQFFYQCYSTNFHMIWLLNKVRNCKSCTREETASCTSANYFFPPYFILWNQNAFQILSQMGKTDIYLWPYFILTLPHSILHFSSTVNSYGLSLCIVPCATVYVTNKIWNWIWNSHWAKLNYRWEYDVSFSHLGLTHVCWGYILQPWLRRTSALCQMDTLHQTE